MAVDTQRVVDYVNIVNIIWSSPVQLVLTIYLLWQQLGVSSLAGLAIMFLLVPFNGFVTNRFKNTQIRLMKEKDARAKLVSEVLSGMKVLKLYAWEGACDFSFGENWKSLNLLMILRMRDKYSHRSRT